MGRDISKLKIVPPFPRITYDDAVKNLQEGHAKARSKRNSNGAAISAPRTKPISRAIRQARDGPSLSRKVKAFYMEPDPERPEVALCVDVLAPEGYGEIIGG